MNTLYIHGHRCVHNLIDPTGLNYDRIITKYAEHSRVVWALSPFTNPQDYATVCQDFGYMLDYAEYMPWQRKTQQELYDISMRFKWQEQTHEDILDSQGVVRLWWRTLFRTHSAQLQYLEAVLACRDRQLFESIQS